MNQDIIALKISPKAGTGQTATDAATGGDHTLTVVAGGKYLVTCTTQAVFGLADVTTAANVRWIVPANFPTIIDLGADSGTTLHYEADVNGGIVRLVQLDV